MRFFLGHRLPLGFFGGFSFRPRDLAGLSRPRSSGVEFVYVFSGSHGLVKIGMTKDVGARLANLQTASAHTLSPHYALAVASGNAWAIEQEAHKLLSGYRSRGEWFDVTPDRAEATINEAARNLGIEVGYYGKGGMIEPMRDVSPVAQPEKSISTVNIIGILVFWAVFIILGRATGLL